jgi:hypothetical protein
LQFLQPVLGLYLQVLARLAQSRFKLLRLVEGALFEGFASFDHGCLKLFELEVVVGAEVVYSSLAFLPVLAQLAAVHFLAQKVLPVSDLRFQLSYLSHEGFELDVELDLEAVVCHEFQSLLDEGKDADLFVGVEHAVLVAVEDAHEVLDGADPGETVEIGLVLAKHYFQHLFREVCACHVVLGQRTPDGLALLRAAVVGIGLAFDLGDHGGV